MENKAMYWAGTIVFIIGLITVFVLSGNYEAKNLEICKQLRIRPFTEKFFSWGGIVELNQKGEYQPKCI